MEKVGKYCTRSLQIVFSALTFLITSCSIPKVIVYEDPLTAMEHNDLGVVYEKKGLLDMAEKEYRKAIKKDSTWYLPYFNLGNVYYKKGDLDKAFEFYEKALEIEEHPDVLNNIAYVLYEKGDYTEALKFIEKALTIEKKDAYIDTYDKIKERINPPRREEKGY